MIPSLSRHTQLNYASMLDVHVIPAIGQVPLTKVTAETIWQLRADMAKAGVGDSATRKTLVTLQSMLQRAVEWGRIDSNPAKLVRKPPATRTHVIRPLPPLDVEKIRKALLDEDLHLDAALIAVLAYAGLRPGEALGLRWHDIGERTILVERSVAFGKLKTTKTGKTRTVKLLQPLAETLDTWKRVTRTHAADRPHLPFPGWFSLGPRPRQQLAQAHLRRRRAGRRALPDAPLRPPAQLGVAADRRGRHRRRGRTPGRAQPDDVAEHLRPPVRRARPHANDLGG